jgi:microcystin-dependent protein
MPSHEHALMASPNPGEAISPAGASVARSVGASLYQSGGAAPVELAPEALVEVGGGQPHPNLHPYLTMTFIIALTGLFPSRS